MADVSVKIYKIAGAYTHVNQRYTFAKFARALNEKQALDTVLSQITCGRVKRRKVRITEVKEVSVKECTDPYIVSLSNL
jgi:ribosomal protein L20A (L18A)